VDSLASVIVPCYNEADTIGLLLEAVARQDIGRDRLEVVIADGMSEDRTRQVVQEVAARYKDLRVRIVDNPARSIPAALNRAVDAAHGSVLIRLDAHSIPSDDYVRRCLETLQSTGAANVGGAWEIRPRGEGWVARAIARAASHPLGAGDARYRIQGSPGAVDTVPFGAFRREWIERVGPFDETLLTNEDYEFNYRLRRAGGRVWFDPSIRSTYFARSRLSELWAQYARYGYWKARMLLRHPASLRWRQALPPVFVALTAAGLAAAAWWPPARWLLGIQWLAYGVVLVGAGLVAALRFKDGPLIVGLPAAWLTMHFAWGLSFWWGLVEGLLGRKRE
jgi:cellulose synthase/poly-beta-1,6-N-acetylglucosamine synthase-like glycosyltransferase